MKDTIASTFGPKILPRVFKDYDGKLKQVLRKIERNGMKKIGLTTTKNQRHHTLFTQILCENTHTDI
jgi:K+-transporting ATPase A subunit